MTTGKSAIAIVLLSIYAMVLCHAFIPHFHFDTSDLHSAKHMEEHEGHSHHHHGHSHTSHSEETWFDYLTDLLNDLGHKDQGEVHLEELIFENNSQDSEVIRLTAQLDDFIQFLTIELELDSDNEKAEIYIQPPILYEQLRSSFTFLRGPPIV